MRSSFLLFITILLCSCKYQEIDMNTANWFQYETNVENKNILFSLPSKGKLIIKPKRNISLVYESDSTVEIALIGYDYGSMGSNNNSELWILLQLNRYRDTFSPPLSMDDFKDRVLGGDMRRMEDINGVPENEVVEIKIISGREWLHEVGNKVVGESYSIPFTDKYYLSIGARYGEYMRKNKQWLDSRRALSC